MLKLKKKNVHERTRKKTKQHKIFPPSFSVYNVQGDGAAVPVRLKGRVVPACVFHFLPSNNRLFTH